MRTPSVSIGVSRPLFWVTVKTYGSLTGSHAIRQLPFWPFLSRVMHLRPFPPRACSSKSTIRQRFM